MPVSRSPTLTGLMTPSRLTWAETLTVPLPTVGIYAGLALTPSWVLSGRADVFRMKLRGDDGQLLNLQANLVYRVTPNIGLGLASRHEFSRTLGTASEHANLGNGLGSLGHFAPGFCNQNSGFVDADGFGQGFFGGVLRVRHE